jgi:hypothetical protein
MTWVQRLVRVFASIVSQQLVSQLYGCVAATGAGLFTERFASEYDTPANEHYARSAGLGVQV